MLRFVALLIAITTVFPVGSAQPIEFGSADDPMEQPRTVFGGPRSVSAAYLGPSYIDDSWLAVGAVSLEGRAGPWSIALGGSLHLGADGLYQPEIDEPYDLVRLLSHARHDPTVSLPVYVRIGPPANVSLGRGHLVRGYRTTTSIDERTIGAEIAARSSIGSIGAFTGDVRMNYVSGAFAEIAPFGDANRPGIESLRLGAGAVYSFADTLAGAPKPTAVQLEASVDVLQFGEFSVSPYVSFAEFLNYGRSIGGGVEAGSENLIGAGRTTLRVGLYYSGDGFVPGYFDPFYQVSNGSDRIVSADSFYDSDTLSTVLLGTPLGDVTSGVDLLTEFELVIFRSFEITYHFRRHYGDQKLSDFSLRVASRPRFLDGLRVELGIERQGLGSFFDLFTGLKDQNALVFDIDYPLARSAHLSIRSRYGYRRLPDAADGAGQYIIQRRFEPLVGVRYVF